MKDILYFGGNKFTKFYLLDLFSNNFIECSEQDFDNIVTKYRDLYELEYDTPNRQLFLINGQVQAIRER